MHRVEVRVCHFSEAVERFEYIECPGTRFVPSWMGWGEAADPSQKPGTVQRDEEAPADNLAAPDLEKRIDEERRRAFEAGRSRGIEEGRTAEREAHTQALQNEEQKRIGQVAGWLEQFGREREQYFRSIEPEVVRLAMAVAARILRREATSDPLLLMGSVRAALRQIAGASEARLRVPAADLDLWIESIALLPNLAVKPSVVSGGSMLPGQCALETELGTADLDVSAQLAEIERALLGSGAAGRREQNAVVSSESLA